ncbi:MAG: ribbon-helix-helix domain-containing protein [Nitrosopumilus sp.]|nr:ribbon-helix-helix domain-containing protein [Nitrosopumilus sp.]
MVSIQEPTKSGWLAIQIPRKLAEEIEDFVNSSKGKEMGFTKKAQAVATACREFLEKNTPKQLILTNEKQDRNLVFNIDSNGKPKCALHGDDDCECIKELKASRVLKRLAKKKGFEIKI